MRQNPTPSIHQQDPSIVSFEVPSIVKQSEESSVNTSGIPSLSAAVNQFRPVEHHYANTEEEPVKSK
jgi:hypothetical protein